jgi:hypothetical protein
MFTVLRLLAVLRRQVINQHPSNDWMLDLPSLDQCPGSDSKPEGGMDAEFNPPDPVQAEVFQIGDAERTQPRLAPLVHSISSCALCEDTFRTQRGSRLAGPVVVLSY